MSRLSKVLTRTAAVFASALVAAMLTAPTTAQAAECDPNPFLMWNTDSRYEYFYSGAGLLVTHSWELRPSSNDYSAIVPMPNSPIASTCAAGMANRDGRLEIFVGGPNGDLLHTWQVPGSKSGWSDWASLGGLLQYGSSITVDYTVDSTMYVRVRGVDGRDHTKYQDGSGSTGWSPNWL